ncbi:MAG: hypothetical protein K2N73_06840 [Lachnospiraceae bacterium]|nr:hypothetical protein [Lachnospiraceae bacterium]
MISEIKKMIHRRLKRFSLNNGGSALVSVVAVAVFLSVIATTIVYISGKNYQIKANDYQNKNTFYKAEMALDEFKGALAADVSDAFKFAYKEVMPDFAYLENGDDRNENFKKYYFDYLFYKWTGATKYGTDIPSDVTTHVTIRGESIYTTVANFTSGLTNFDTYFIKEDELASGDEKMCVAFDDKKEGRFIIKNVRVWCTENGYSSYICTDIAMDPPVYYMGVTTPPAGGTPDAEDTKKDKLYMGDYILYMNWHKY